MVAMTFLVVLSPLLLPVEAFAQDHDVDFIYCRNPLDEFANCMQIAATSIVNVLVATAGLVLYIAGSLFEATLHFSIYHAYNSNQAVQAGWVIIRDLINILFIFILLYIALGTVLKIEKVNWKKQLAAVIIAAILVNFSLFLTRVVIDGSNILALGLHRQITTCNDTSLCPEGEMHISTAIMNYIGLQKTFEDNIFSAETHRNDGLRNGLIRLVLICIVAWAFIKVALLFVARTVMFVILMITSPVGVAGASLPLLQEQAKEWRVNLLNQAMVGPVFLVLIYIVLQMAHHLLNLEATGDAGADLLGTGASASSGTLNANFWLNLILIVGFIFAAVNITKKFSGQAGEVINKAVGTAVGVGVGAVGLAAGGGALLARSTLGAASGAILRSDAGKALAGGASSNNMATRLASRAAHWSLRTANTASYDVRRAPGFGRLLNQADKTVAGGVARVGMNRLAGGEKAQRERKEKAIQNHGLYQSMDEAQLRNQARRHNPNSQHHKVLMRMANRRAGEEAREEQQRIMEEVTGNIQDIASGRTGGDIQKELGRLRGPQQVAQVLSQLPPEQILRGDIISQLGEGDLEALKNTVDRSTLQKIVSSNDLSERAARHVDNPENKFPEPLNDPGSRTPEVPKSDSDKIVEGLDKSNTSMTQNLDKFTQRIEDSLSQAVMAGMAAAAAAQSHSSFPGGAGPSAGGAAGETGQSAKRENSASVTREFATTQVKNMNTENAKRAVDSKGGFGKLPDADVISFALHHRGTDIGTEAREEMRKRNITSKNWKQSRQNNEKGDEENKQA